jgi:hypothetical protein
MGLPFINRLNLRRFAQISGDSPAFPRRAAFASG